MQGKGFALGWLGGRVTCRDVEVMFKLVVVTLCDVMVDFRLGGVVTWGDVTVRFRLGGPSDLGRCHGQI